MISYYLLFEETLARLNYNVSCPVTSPKKNIKKQLTKAIQPN